MVSTSVQRSRQTEAGDVGLYLFPFLSRSEVLDRCPVGFGVWRSRFSTLVSLSPVNRQAVGGGRAASGRWAVGGGRWAVGGGRWAVDGGRRAAAGRWVKARSAVEAWCDAMRRV